jgi:hypothetical protein
MSLSRHPAIELQIEYENGVCSPGAALAVATHFALCEQCAGTQAAKPWPLPEALAIDYGNGGAAYKEALGAKVLEAWRGDEGATRTAFIRGVSGICEAVYLVEAASAETLVFPGAARFLVVLQGGVTDGASAFARGDFVDLTTAHSTALNATGPYGSVCLLITETA